MNDFIRSFVDVWPAVVIVEAGSLAFVALDAANTLAELDRERESARQALSNSNMDVDGVRMRIAELEERAKNLADQRKDIMARKAGIDHAPPSDWMDGWFDGIITAVAEEKSLALLEEERRRQENLRIEARTKWLQARAQGIAVAAETLQKEADTKKAETEIALRLTPLRECLAQATERRIKLEETASDLEKQIEQKQSDANEDPMKRLMMMSAHVRLEAVQKEFRNELMLEAELERKIIELCEKKS